MFILGLAGPVAQKVELLKLLLFLLYTPIFAILRNHVADIHILSIFKPVDSDKSTTN